MSLPTVYATARILEDECLFMSDKRNERVEFLRKELEVYVDLLNKFPYEMYKKTAVRLNQACANPNVVGKENAEQYFKWFMNQKSKNEFLEWLLSQKHKVDGKFGNWSAGGLGSRWADCEINGKKCRLAFYSIKTNEIDSVKLKLNDCHQYLILMDPTL
jgi:hypothetical protein